MAGAAGRPMKYPYTFTAKIAQFPFKFHWDNSPIYKWWLISCIVCIPMFYKIQKMSKSPANVEKWDKILDDIYNPKEGSHH